MKHSDRYPLCPNCGMKVDNHEKFCWYCSESIEKHTQICTECGQYRNLSRVVAKWVEEARKV